MAASEQRDAMRVNHSASLVLENLPAGAHYDATMLNYSRGGMYFESNYAPLPGTEIYIGMERSPYDSSPDLYRAQVRWRRKLLPHDSKYSYGVGVKYHYPVNF